MRLVPVVLVVALVVYALIDCLRAPSDNSTGLPKALWVLLILLFPGLGAAAWLIISRVGRSGERTSRTRPTAPRRGPRTSPRRTGPLAPDDDPEFLARLEAEQRRQRREQRRREKNGGKAAGGRTAEPGAGPANPPTPASPDTGPADGPEGDHRDGQDDDGSAAGPAPRREA